MESKNSANVDSLGQDVVSAIEDVDELDDEKESSHYEISPENWSIETYLRVKPCTELLRSDLFSYSTQAMNLEHGERRDLFSVEIPLDADPGLLHNNSYSGILEFQFDKVFNVNASQEEVFSSVAKSKIDAVFDGVNSTIFAYGQTGSGKTYSIFGGENFSERGIIPRSISGVFASIKERKKNKKINSFKCRISFTEIYQEVIYDLLDSNKRSSLESFPVVQLYEGEEGVLLKNLNVFEVSTEEEALQLFFMGNSNRITTSTSMNNASSRSHAIFTLIIDTEGIVDDRTLFTSGKINLVDLAGSERMYKLPNSKDMIKEAKSINLSLHYLEQVIVCLRENLHNPKAVGKKSSFVPYRNSVLTNMLRDSLGGNCKSCFLLTITPEKSHFEETVATCRFGQRCGEVKVQVSRNTEVGLNDQLKDLTQRVRVLERKLATAEENKRNFEAAFKAERELRLKQTELRTLTEQEKLACKACVQELLAAAKESLTILDVENAKEISEQLIEHSQDVLYNAVEEMDKTVLVELSTALGGLVQSMYIEREMSKREEIVKEEKKRQLEEERKQKELKELKVLEILHRGDHEELEHLQRLPDSIIARITEGAIFIKHGRFGTKAARFVQISKDLTVIYWRDVIGGKIKSSHHFFIVDFESIECGKDGDRTFTLKGKPGAKSLTLEYAEADGAEGFAVWLEAVRFLILHKPV